MERSHSKMLWFVFCVSFIRGEMHKKETLFCDKEKACTDLYYCDEANQKCILCSSICHPNKVQRESSEFCRNNCFVFLQSLEKSENIATSTQKYEVTTILKPNIDIANYTFIIIVTFCLIVALVIIILSVVLLYKKACSWVRIDAKILKQVSGKNHEIQTERKEVPSDICDKKTANHHSTTTNKKHFISHKTKPNSIALASTLTQTFNSITNGLHVTATRKSRVALVHNESEMTPVELQSSTPVANDIENCQQAKNSIDIEAGDRSLSGNEYNVQEVCTEELTPPKQQIVNSSSRNGTMSISEEKERSHYEESHYTIQDTIQQRNDQRCNSRDCSISIDNEPSESCGLLSQNASFNAMPSHNQSREEVLVQPVQPQDGFHYDGNDHMRQIGSMENQNVEDDPFNGGYVGNYDDDCNMNPQPPEENEGYIPADAEIVPLSNPSDSGVCTIVNPDYQNRSGFHDLHFDNNPIYEQLQQIAWVMGYHSQGGSISVFANLDQLGADNLKQELCNRLNLPQEKFKMRQHVMP